MFSLRSPIVWLLLAIVAIAFIGGPHSMSLATDVGVSDADACAAVEGSGPTAIARLNASAFPHASTKSVEVYKLTSNGQDEGAVRIDWARGQASCLDPGASDVPTATMDMSPGAYGIVVAELKHVLETGKTTGHVANWLKLMWPGAVSIHAPDAPGGEGSYKWSLASWAAGVATQHAGGTDA